MGSLLVKTFTFQLSFLKIIFPYFNKILFFLNPSQISGEFRYCQLNIIFK